ncbi:MAG: hypothetical protein GTN40_00120 [Candidatus Aenigmarchaeota archaeon]|nr:hypothetical protein [Candidatus Aenigmarchaeota archaeon]
MKTKNENQFSSITSQKSTFQVLFLMLAVVLILLPFLTTFNDLITRLIMSSQLYRLLQDYLAPFYLKIITVIMNILGIKTVTTTETLSLLKSNGGYFSARISWNCIGWQSVIFLVISFIIGLRGSFKISSKFECILFGILGTFFASVLRVSLVTLVGYFWGSFTAILFHDYIGNILMIVWLIFFWWFSYAYVLVPKEYKSR